MILQKLLYLSVHLSVASIYYRHLGIYPPRVDIGHDDCVPGQEHRTFQLWSHDGSAAVPLSKVLDLIQ